MNYLLSLFILITQVVYTDLINRASLSAAVKYEAVKTRSHPLGTNNQNFEISYNLAQCRENILSVLLYFIFQIYYYYLFYFILFYFILFCSNLSEQFQFNFTISSCDLNNLIFSITPCDFLEYTSMLLNLEYALKCDAFVGTLASNWCRLVDELRATVGKGLYERDTHLNK